MHRVVNPDSLPRPSGYSHAVVASEGRTVYLAGQTAQGKDGRVVAGTMAAQFDLAAANLRRALDAADARPEHLVSMQIFVTDMEAYSDAMAEIGAAYRKHFGRHYPAITLLEVRRLLDPAAMVELMAVAVVPHNA